MRDESLLAVIRAPRLWGRGGTGLILALLLLLTTIGPVSVPALADARPPTTDAGRVLHVGDDGLVVQWTPAPLETRVLADGHAAVTVPGYSRTGAAGRPLLPVSAHLVALPPGAAPRLRILRIHQTRAPLRAPLERVPWPEALPGELAVDPSTPLGVGPAMSAADRSDPPQAVVFEELGTVRGVRLARLAFYPAVLEDGGLLVTREVRVALSWDAPLPPETPTADPLLDQVRALVLNPEHVRPEPRTPVDDLSSQAYDLGAAAASTTALIEVAEPGLYRVGYEDLEDLGFAGVDPTTLRLFRDSDEVAYHWVGGGDGQFGPGEYLIFYAEPRFSRWTEVDVFRLEAHTGTGLPMESRTAHPNGLTGGVASVERLLEENELYMPDSSRGYLPPGRDGDRWAWKTLTRPGQDTVELPFDLQAADLSQGAELTLWFNGFTFAVADPDHRVQVTVNGQLLGHVEWDGPTAHEATLSIPAGVLQASGNTLRLHLPGIPGVANEGCWLDAFAVRHARSIAQTGTDLIFTGEGAPRAYTVGLADASGLRAYDVTDPLRPQLLTGVQVDGNLVQLGDPPGGGPRRYALVAASGIMSPRRVRAPRDLWGLNARGQPARADMLIVTHPDFAPALDPLVALRESQGLSVAVVDVLGIYDTWGDGRLDPGTIRAFIKHAYESWDPVPTYVLLVGDGSFDPRQYRPTSPPTFLPPYLADVDPWVGEAAADNRYVSVDGDDNLPDMLIGRLPVKTLEEAHAVVSKTLAYEADPGEGRWNRDVVLAAGYPEGAQRFPDRAESLADVVPSSYRLTRYYCTERDPELNECSAPRSREIHEGLMRSWNQGAFLIGFFGHASWQQWAAPPYLHLDHLPSLTNGPRAPVVLGMACFTSAFQRPEPTLDESLVTLAEGGAVATWGGTGLGLTMAHEVLAQGFFQAVFVDQVSTVGEAQFAGKLHLHNEDVPNPELIDTFVVLGDPALVLNRDGPREIFLPLVVRGG